MLMYNSKANLDVEVLFENSLIFKVTQLSYKELSGENWVDLNRTYRI